MNTNNPPKARKDEGEAIAPISTLPDGAPLTYELINPSDSYTFTAPSRLIAALTVVLLGRGKYGAIQVRPDRGDKEGDVPLFFFGGSDEWFKKTFGGDLEGLFEAHKPEVANCLDTFIVGTIIDRETYYAGLKLASGDAAKIEEWEKHWDSKHRGSMNNIKRAAVEYARLLRTPNANH